MVLSLTSQKSFDTVRFRLLTTEIMLKELNLENWNKPAWCVPSAISMITGISVAKMHELAAKMQGKETEKVKGVFMEEAVLLLRNQGYKAIPIKLSDRYQTAPTIETFLEKRTPYEFCMPIMFATVNHMMCAHFGFAGDNWTKKPVPINQFPSTKRRVVAAWVITEDRTTKNETS